MEGGQRSVGVLTGLHGASRRCDDVARDPVLDCTEPPARQLPGFLRQGGEWVRRRLLLQQELPAVHLRGRLRRGEELDQLFFRRHRRPEAVEKAPAPKVARRRRGYEEEKEPPRVQGLDHVSLQRAGVHDFWRSGPRQGQLAQVSQLFCRDADVRGVAARDSVAGDPEGRGCLLHQVAAVVVEGGLAHAAGADEADEYFVRGASFLQQISAGRRAEAEHFVDACQDESRAAPPRGHDVEVYE